MSNFITVDFSKRGKDYRMLPGLYRRIQNEIRISYNLIPPFVERAKHIVKPVHKEAGGKDQKCTLTIEK